MNDSLLSGSEAHDAHPTIHVTEQDWKRLTSLLTTTGGRWSVETREALDAELARATVVPREGVGPDVVTMNSRVRFEVGGARRMDRTLVYPWDADELTGRLSVLSPLGSALLGLKIGDTIAWSLPDGTTVDVRVIELLYQPEAAGDHWL